MLIKTLCSNCGKEIMIDDSQLEPFANILPKVACEKCFYEHEALIQSKKTELL